MGNHSICSKCDRALVAYLISEQAGTADDILPGKRSKDKTIPCTICYTHTAKPPSEFPYSGNYMAEAYIEIRTSAVQEDTESDPDQPRLDSDARVSATTDAFFLTEDNGGELLAQAINAAAASTVEDFSVLNCQVVEVNQGFNPRAAAEQGNDWVDTIHLQMLCAPASGLNDAGSLTP